jgi:CheY-like chemotaxis protein
VFHKNLPLVLLVEDSPDDIDFAVRTLAILSEAARMPAGSGRFWPSLILLDLNTPGMSGAELLTRLKGDDLLRAIPVVVLSTSRQPSDLEQCYRLHANAYHVKPHDFAEYQQTLLAIVEYWLVAVLPAPSAGETAAEAAVSDPT